MSVDRAFLERLILRHYGRVRVLRADARSLADANERLRKRAPPCRLHAAVSFIDRASRTPEAITVAVGGVVTGQDRLPFAVRHRGDEVVDAPALLAADFFGGGRGEPLTNVGAVLDAFGAGAEGRPCALAERSAQLFAEGLSAEEIEALGGIAALRELAAKFRAVEADRLAKAIGAVREKLDGEVLALLGPSRSWTASEYGWYASPGERGGRRRQAAGVYRLFAVPIARLRSLREAVDGGEPLGERLVEALSDAEGRLSVGMLKRLQKAAATPSGLPIAQVVSFLRRIPPDWTPASPADWQAFLDVLAASERLETASCQPLRSLLEGCGGRWWDFLRSMVWSIDHGEAEDCRARRDAALARLLGAREEGHEPRPERRQALLDACRKANRLVEAFADHVVLPAAGWVAKNSHRASWPALDEGALSAARRLAARILFEGKNAPSVLELARRFAHHEAEVVERIVGEEAERWRDIRREGEEWPGLTDGPVEAPPAYGRLRFMPLRNRAELAREGEECVNCVGTYGSRCERGESHIISIRAPDGAPCGTLEIAWIESPRRPRVRIWQLYSPRAIDVPVGRQIDLSAGHHAIVRHEGVCPEFVIFRRSPDGGRELGRVPFYRLREPPEALELDGVRVPVTRQAALELFQIRSDSWRGNRAPPESVREAVAWYARGIERGEIPLNVIGLETYMEELAKRDGASHDALLARCGYDYGDARRVAEAFRLFAELPGGGGALLGKRWRRRGARGLVEDGALRAIADHLAEPAGAAPAI